MIKPRFAYFILIVTTIIFGLLSRHIAGIPLFIGDILWATMVYFIVKFLFISKPVRFVVTISLLFCYAIEFSQLYQAPWINNIRDTLIGGLILGKGFLWGDMLSYTIGVGIGVIIEMIISKT